jgi:hypothetical protein
MFVRPSPPAILVTFSINCDPLKFHIIAAEVSPLNTMVNVSMRRGEASNADHWLRFERHQGGAVRRRKPDGPAPATFNCPASTEAAAGAPITTRRLKGFNLRVVKV